MAISVLCYPASLLKLLTIMICLFRITKSAPFGSLHRQTISGIAHPKTPPTSVQLLTNHRQAAQSVQERRTSFRYCRQFFIRGGAEEEIVGVDDDVFPALNRRASSPSSLPRPSPFSAIGRRNFSTKPSKHETNLHVSVYAAQGQRSYMEDEYVVAQDFAAVFDGHGGPSVSRYLKSNLFANLQSALPWVIDQRQKLEQEDQKENRESSSRHSKDPSEPTVQDFCVALRMALDKVDREVQRISHWSYQGSTAVAAWIHRNTTAEDTTLVVANVGDSRAIYGCNGIATPLTKDHKPDDPDEVERIESLGGKVIWCGPYDKKGNPILSQGIYRVNGNLALSRAIGDRSERPAVTAEPDITVIKVLPEELQKKQPGASQPKQAKGREYVIVATDGLWDVFANQEVVDVVDILLDKTSGSLRYQRSQIAEVLVREALRRGALDNVTVVIIWLNTEDGNDVEEEQPVQQPSEV